MRRGFTLAELVAVLAILAIAAAAATPAITPFIGDEAEGTTEALARVLRSARATALKEARTTAVVLNPESGRYTVAISGSEPAAGVLPLREGVHLQGAEPRIRFDFAPSGPGTGGPVTVQEPGRTTVVSIDRWTGEIHVRAP